MVGEFALVPVGKDPLFSHFAVIDVRWLAISPTMNAGTPLIGSGFYRLGGEVAVQQQMALDLVVGTLGRMHFDSGLVVGGGGFPRLDVLLSTNGFDYAACMDTRLHVIAEPTNPNNCGGIAGIPCAAGQFCKLSVGECCCDFMGVCVPIPTACPDVWMPVCGCDGQTYGNECEADMAGVTIAHVGECGKTCAFPGDPACGTGTFCKFATGSCGTAGDVGVCAPVPEVCPMYFSPVCGCDGMTYGNECEADHAGVSVAHLGACDQACGGIGGFPCATGEFCKLPGGMCNVTDLMGVCRPVPDACPAIWAPVCGCDGVTYGNECEADKGAVQIDHVGPCEPGPCVARRVLVDPDLTYCPDQPHWVRILLTPPSGALAIAVEDMPPPGWAVDRISDGGGFDPVHHKVKWGPFFAPFPAEVSYVVMPAADARGPLCFAGSVSVDGVNQRTCGDECLDPCCPHAPADMPREVCDLCAVNDCNDCDAAVCNDGQIAMCELIGYACAWMKGCNDDLAGMTRAAYLWRNGECYCWDAASHNWHPTPCGSSMCCGDATLPHGPAAAVASSTGAKIAGELRALPDERGQRRDRYEITVEVFASGGSTAMAAEVELPKNWTVVSVGDGGAYDAANQKLKWGPFFDGLSRTVTAVVHVSSGRAAGKVDMAPQQAAGRTVSGTISIDGVNQSFRLRE